MFIFGVALEVSKVFSHRGVEENYFFFRFQKTKLLNVTVVYCVCFCVKLTARSL